MLQLRHVLSAAPSSENVQGSMNLGFKDPATGVTQAIERRRHPFDDGCFDPALYVLDGWPVCAHTSAG